MTNIFIAIAIGFCIGTGVLIAFAFLKRKDRALSGTPMIETAEASKEKYGNNRLPDFVSKSIISSLEQYMHTDKPWLKVDLTLAQLAQGINVNSHHLSQIINLHFGKTFACFINEYRVNEACKHLSGCKDKSVLDIALESGFASKSSFNSLFKKQTGLTPSEYRKKYLGSGREAA